MQSPHNIGSTLSEKLANLKVGYFNVLLANASNRLWQITPICFRRDGLRPESAISGFVTLEHFQTQVLKIFWGTDVSAFCHRTAILWGSALFWSIRPT